jgi:hypothetical protein
MPQMVKRVIFSESCSTISIELRCGASDGTLKSMKMKLSLSTSPTDLDHLGFVSH